MKQFLADSVLIVEDDPSLRETVAEILVDAGCRITAVSNGMEAFLQLAQRAHADLPSAVLLDLQMPVMDGWEFRRLMLQNLAWAAIPVIVTTAIPLPECKLPQLEPVAVLPKPYDVSRLLQLLEPYRGPSRRIPAAEVEEDETEFFLCSVAEAFALADAGFVEDGYDLLLHGSAKRSSGQPPALNGLWADALRRFRERFGLRLH